MTIGQCEKRTKVMRMLRKLRKYHLITVNFYDSITDRLFDN